MVFFLRCHCREVVLSPTIAALLSSGVQGGFAIGAVIFAVFGLADRFDPRRVFALSALIAAACNALLLIAPVGGIIAIVARLLTGVFLAGVYPVGMKIAVGWGTKDRGFLVGLIVGALTLGSAAPNLLSFMGGADWRLAVGAASLLSAIGGCLVLFSQLGPHHASATKFSVSSLKLAWSDRRIRLAYAGYLGHMWELYAMWAWIGVSLSVSFSMHMPAEMAESQAKLVSFFAVGVGSMACIVAGLFADRIGKARIAILSMMGSAAMAVLAAIAFSGPPFLLIGIVILWGAFVIADSAQFSALVADAAPPDAAGTLMTLQTALGFALTVITVQLAPHVANIIGWQGLFLVLAIGPILGIFSMQGLRETPSAKKT